MNDNDVLKELVQKAAAGDNTAFEELYQETCRSVYFTCGIQEYCHYQKKQAPLKIITDNVQYCLILRHGNYF